MKLNQIKKVVYSKRNQQQNKKRNHCMGGHIWQWYIGEGVNFQATQSTYTTQHQEDKQSN